MTLSIRWYKLWLPLAKLWLTSFATAMCWEGRHSTSRVIWPQWGRIQYWSPERERMIRENS